VSASLKTLEKGLGASDRTRLDQYFDSLREVEMRIQRAEARTNDSALDLPEKPFDVPSSFEEHVRLMFDLQVLAYRADLTRVITFQLGKEQSARSYPNIGVTGPHHGISHHQNDPDKMAQKAKIDAYHIHLLTYYIEKLKNTPDGDGSLLDHVVILYGGGLGDPNYHEQFDLASVIVGGGCGRVKGGRYVPYPTDEAIPFMNLLVTLLHKVGVPAESLGDSKGELQELSDV
jgi:hypothetical protein